MARKSSSKASRLSADESRLEQLHAETLQRQQELEKKLKRLPVQLAQREEQKKVEAHKRAVSAGRAISSRPRGGRSGSRSLRTPSRQRWLAKRNTVILLVVLGIILFLLWNVIPTT